MGDMTTKPSHCCVSGKVIPWHRPINKYGSKGRLKHPKDAEYQAWIALCYRAQGGKYYGGEAVIVSVDICRALPERAKHPERDLHTPDVDNVTKNVLDALEGVAYDNDCQVVGVYASKHDRTRCAEHLVIQIQPIPNIPKGQF